MGYGNGKKDGIRAGKSHDDGIDGVISQDGLGLDTVCVQAKRYSEGNNIGRREIQMYVDAMENVNKGVFITGPTFTKEARIYVNGEQQKIEFN